MAGDDDDAPNGADGAEAPLEGTEVIVLKVELDLVPDWSNTLERIAAAHAARVVMGIEGQAFVVKIAIRPFMKQAFLADVQRYWEAFVERRKREGRWRR